MAVAMETQSTIVNQPPPYVVQITTTKNAPKTVIPQGFTGFFVQLPPTHANSRDVGMSRLYAKLHSYLQAGHDWDGYGGEPATYASWSNAVEFLHVLPIRFDAPIPMLAGDGEISLFWKEADSYIEISFPGDGTFHYIYNAPGQRFASADLALNEAVLHSGFLAHLGLV
jgi:hypothetical protein